jgi:hypothetical protein
MRATKLTKIKRKIKIKELNRFCFKINNRCTFRIFNSFNRTSLNN